MAKKNNNRKQPWSIPLRERETLYNGINPSADFGIGSFLTQGLGYLGGFRTGKGMNEDEARWAAYLGLPYDKEYAPDTNIRFEQDNNYPDRQYQGISKRAKKEIREKVIPEAKRIKDEYGKEWIQVLDKRGIFGNDSTIYHPRETYTGDLGKFGIREVGNSGIYEIGDKYDFPSWVPVPDRNEGTELMIRDTIWSDRANPKLYNQEVIKRKNKYSLGSWFKGATGDIKNWNEGITNKLMGSNFGQGLSNLGIKAGGLGGIANIGATAIGGLAAGGRSSAVGNTMQKVGSLASNIPGVGGLIGAGVNLLGGVFNGAFGSKLNAENIASVEGDIKQALNFTSNASDYDALASNYAGLQGVRGFNKDFIGKDGWWGGSKAKDKFNSLKTQAEEAEAHQLLALSNNAANIANTNLQLMEANYSAYGGPIHIKPSKRGTFTAAAKKRGIGVQEFANKVLSNKEDYSPAMVKKANFARNTSKWHDDGGPLYYPKTNEKGQVVLNPDNPQDIKWLREQQGKRGARAVNKSKREAVPLIGTVLGLPLAGTLGTTIGLGGISAIGDAASIIMNPSDPLNYIGMPWTKMAKQADKILDVSKAIDSAVDNSKIVNIPVYHGSNKVFDDFNYASSQNIGVHAGTRKAANDRLNAIGAKEEANIREGILTMNENNIIPIKDIQNFDVYNISQLYDNNMLFKQSLKKAGIKDNIFKQYITPMADDYQTLLDNKKLVDDLAERGIMFKYINKGEDIGSTSYLITNPNRVTWSKNRIKKFGGELFTNGVTTIGNGGTHESNPYEGVQMGIDPQGVPNLVEEGEVVFNDYVFSNRLIVPDAVREKYKLRGNKELSFADAAKQIQKESEERPNDPISKRGLESAMSRLQQAQETVREEKQASQESREYAHGGKMGILFDGLGEDSNWLRYAPVVGSAIGLGQNLFNSPDYSGPNAILSAAESAGRYTPVGYSPIGNYLKYNPFDRDFYINKLNAQAGATRRATTNTSGGNRAAAMAGLLAADYNYGNQLGALARQAEEYNLAQRQAVETFNRATNMANAEMGLKAAMANQEAALNAGRARLSGTAQAMTMRDEIAARRGASMSANLTNLFDSLGNIGIDKMNRADRDFYIKHVMGANLPLEEYRRLYGLDAAKKEAKKRGFTDNEITKLFKNGGQLKKKRGGFTY